MMSMRSPGRNGAAWLICTLTLMSSLLYAQEKVGIETKNFLWKAQSKKNTVYLLGSVHFLKKENYPLPPRIEMTFSDARKLVLEINLDNQDRQSVQQMIVLKGMYPHNTTLQENISKKTYEWVEKRAKELGMDIQALNRLQPWFVALTLSALKLQTLGFDPNYGIDQYFAEKAKKEKKEIVALETWEDQINLFVGMSQESQELLLLRTLRDLEVMEKELTRIVRSWTVGDVRTIETLLLESFKEYPQVYRRLISDRNRNWLPKIEELLDQDENYIVVVGAGHLVGKEGIIALLKEKGYSVDQL